MGVTNSAQSGHIFGLMSCWQNEISGSFCTFYNVRDMPRRPCCRRSCRYRSGPSARGRGMVGGASWTFLVTVRHADSGWEDYADGWRVLDGQGSVLGTRVLFHPHVTEQPFTRSLSGVKVPNGASFVMLQTRTKPEGWGAALYSLEIAD
jgi:hypothetical protein